MESPLSHGFTLIEILVSITLLLVLSGLFIANYTGFNSSQTVHNAALDVITNLQTARTNASSGVKPAGCDTLIGYIVTFPTTSTYTVQASCMVGAAGEIKSYKLPTGVTFSPIPSVITFYALDRGASADQVISLTGSGTTVNVSVFASGVVSQ